MRDRNFWGIKIFTVKILLCARMDAGFQKNYIVGIRKVGAGAHFKFYCGRAEKRYDILSFTCNILNSINRVSFLFEFNKKLKIVIYELLIQNYENFDCVT